MSDALVDDAISTVKSYSRTTSVWSPLFSKFRSSVSNGERLLKKAASAPSEEELLDALAESYFGCLFLAAGFEVSYEPSGKAGPDFEMKKDGRCLFVGPHWKDSPKHPWN